ncbi:MAG: hypothetical protein LBC94_01410 [Desulfovibrio sp.]|jgi:hypothetical protein|nr:hypothetical protein [Desulfovibrio sp.]
MENLSGEKIVSQPIAVIEVLSLTKGDSITRVCPPPFFEDTPDYEIDNWMNMGIEVLSSFTMDDNNKDGIRKKCLHLIQKASRANSKTQKIISLRGEGR